MNTALWIASRLLALTVSTESSSCSLNDLNPTWQVIRPAPEHDIDVSRTGAGRKASNKDAGHAGTDEPPRQRPSRWNMPARGWPPGRSWPGDRARHPRARSAPHRGTRPAADGHGPALNARIGSCGPVAHDPMLFRV